MKKLLCFTMSLLLLTTVFSGCSNKNDTAKIENLINTAFELNEKLNDLDLSSVTTNFYDYGTSSNYTKKSSELKVHNINDSKKYEMSEITSQSISSTTTRQDYEEYYRNGYYYTTRYGGAFKTKISAKKAGIDNIGSLVNIKYSDMRSVGFKTENDEDAETKWGKGYTAITFTCKNSALKSYMGRADEDNADDYEDLKIKSGEGEYVINADGYLVYESLEVISVITVDGSEITSKISTEIIYNDIGKEVDPYNPEDESFVEVDNIENVIEINAAMSNTLSSNDYEMRMEAEAEILQDKTEVGYKRTYIRQQDITDREYAQKAITTYFSEDESGSQLESSQYYTDGRYYQISDMYNQKLYCVMDFPKFVSSVYTKTAVSPASVYSTGMMKNIKTTKSDKGVVYNYELNPDSNDGLIFLSSLVGPYEHSFGGNFSTAKTTVNSFSGKMYVDENGKYYKMEVDCDVLVKFQEGDVAIKFKQTINIDKVNGNIKCDFPDFSKVDYERVELSELLGSTSTSDTSSK